MLAIALAAAALVQDPLIVIGASPSAALLFDEKSVRQHGEFKRYDQISIPPSPEPYYDGRVTRAKRFQYQVDCLTGSIQPVGFILLDGNGAEIAAHPGSAGIPMSRPPSGSAGEKAAQIACGQDGASADSERFSDIPAAIAEYYRAMASSREAER